MYMKKRERERQRVSGNASSRANRSRKTKDEGETKSTARTHVHLRRWRANIGVFRTRNSITWEDRLGKLPLPRLPFRRQRNVTSLLGRGEEPWVSCLSIVEHAIGESSRFVLLFLLFFFFFFSSLSLFFFFSSKKINVIDLSSIPILLYHQFLRSFIFNFSVCVICVCACVCIISLPLFIAYAFFFGSFKGNRFEFDRFEGGGGRRNRAVRDPLTRARDSCFISIAFIARKLKIERKRKKGAPVAFPSNPDFFFSREIFIIASTFARKKGRRILFR